ncbi:MAG: alpha/beta fold hydrolase [Candidatus Heimdallarchaeota archaeon]|nr:alpha/beta fold hydrolase [Candidatus Heimdallarchaeota archaeon]
MKRKIRLVIIYFFTINLLVAPAVSAENETENDYNPVLLIHGWNGNAAQMDTMIARLIVDGWDANNLFAYSFDDPTDCSVSKIKENAHSIQIWVDEILNNTSQDKLDIIGYSQGGHTARYFMKYLNGTNLVDDFVTLGSSHHYFPEWNVPFCSSSLVEEREFMIGLNDGDQSPGGILEDPIGSRADVLNTSLYYNGIHVAGDVNYTSIYGTGDELDPNYSSFLYGANNILVENVSHVDLVTNNEVYSKVKIAILDRNSAGNISISEGSITNTLSLHFIGYNFLIIFSIIEVSRIYQKWK